MALRHCRARPNRRCYEPIARRERLPVLDPALIERLMTARNSQAQAVRELRAALRDSSR